MRCILKGDIGGISLPDILTFINLIGKNGELVLTREKQRRTLFFERGEIVFASSNDPDDSLGSFLVRSGVISHKDNERASELVGPGKRLGKALIELGLLKPRELWWGVKNQVLDIVYRLFSWKKGMFEFYETDLPVREKIALNTNCSTIIMEGIRRLDEWARIKSRIPSYGVIFEISDTGLTEEPGDEEKKLLKLINGVRSVGDIMKECTVGEFEINRMFYSLLSGGYITVKEKADIVTGEADDDTGNLLNTIKIYNSIFQYIFKRIALKNQGDIGRTFNVFFEDGGMRKNDLFTGISFIGNGCLDEGKLMSNIGDIPADRRNSVLDEGLNDLLSFQLFEMTKYLDRAEKEDLYDFVSKIKGDALSSA